MINPIELFLYAIAGWLPGGEHTCSLCGKKVWRFMPYRGGGQIALMEALEGIGSDIRNYHCPRCGAHDRERHLLLYFEASGLMRELAGKRILHIAPERRLWTRIAAASPVEYVRGDLHPKSADVKKIDIASMPFEDGTFDLVIANHVLEHVGSDILALKEIHRVLAAGGFAVLQTPYSPLLFTTWSDPGISTGAARLQAYGQEDHVRLFGRDIFDRIASCGFAPYVSTHQELLPDVDPIRAGVNPREPFFLFRKGE